MLAIDKLYDRQALLYRVQKKEAIIKTSELTFLSPHSTLIKIYIKRLYNSDFN